MSDLPCSEGVHPHELDHGEVFRPDTKHLPPGPLTVADKKVLFGVLAATAALVTSAVLFVR